MKKTIQLLSMTAFIVCVFGLSGCLEEKVLEVVFGNTTCAEFQENHTSSNWTEPLDLNYADEISQILEDNGISRSDILSAHLVSGTYEVTSFAGAHDWTITGSITVQRLDAPAPGSSPGPATIIDYSSVSIQASLGVVNAVPLNSGGVDVINDALQDFINGLNPVIRFTVNNGSVSPTPSTSDPIVFDWEACIFTQVIVSQTLDVPDPLP